MLQKGIVPSDYRSPVAADWPDLLEIVERLVKPERDKQKRDSNRKRWWIYAENRPGLRAAKKHLDKVTVTSAAAVVYHQMAHCDAAPVYSHKTIVFVEDSPCFVSLLSSRAHEVWRTVFGTTFGSSDALTYNPTDCFQTFSLPSGYKNNVGLKEASERYLRRRSKLLGQLDIGLTTIHRQFHDQLVDSEPVIELRRLHAEMDDAVLRAYGWDDLAELCAPGAEFEPRFLIEDDEPEFAYQGRLFWPAAFRDKVLARLLELNKERAAAEAAAPKTKKRSPDLPLENTGGLL